MNNLMLMILILLLTGCMNYSTNVVKLMGNTTFEEDETVNVRGYIYIEYGDINLYYDKKGGDHIDVAFDNDMTFDKPLKESKYICVDLTGKFRQYSEGYIGVSNANSKHGIVVVTDIKRCKQRL